MASTSTKFIEFNQEYDDWQIYEERLEQHFNATSTTDESVKKGILLSSLGPSTYKLLRDLCFPEKPKDKTFVQLCSILSTQFKSQISTWRERIKFYNLQQAENEAIGDWYARVRSGAVSCNFGAELTSCLRDRFLCGLSNGRILDRLCEEKENEDVENLVKLAMKVENVVKSGSGSINVITKFPPRQRHHGSHVGNLPNRQRERTHMGARSSAERHRNPTNHERGSHNDYLQTGWLGSI